jgi:hemerythrin
MEKFIWKDEYSVGIPSIDEQHKYFFEITNRMIDLAEGLEPTHEKLLVVMGELGDYAMYHLSTEEGYFDKFAYEGAPEHVKVHNLYRQKIADYLKMAEDPKSDLAKLIDEVASYSIDWLSNHILFMDKKYTVFFKEHGIA